MNTDEARQLADELRRLAAIGINFAKHTTHNEERWRPGRGASARLAALAGDGRSPEELLARYRANHFDVGPLASGEAVVMRDDKLLLVRRTDDDLWALPGGITDPGETLSESARRE